VSAAAISPAAPNFDQRRRSPPCRADAVASQQTQQFWANTCGEFGKSLMMDAREILEVHVVGLL